jgi:hypothetical protein
MGHSLKPITWKMFLLKIEHIPKLKHITINVIQACRHQGMETIQ